ncbi:motility protein B [mine drainage metagenome]|uniref:Motility protein B n=1 Tax=mine drainage metagenome TaxID=410659 RepID=A0A1J5T4G2_9ZZZZ
MAVVNPEISKAVNNKSDKKNIRPIIIKKFARIIRPHQSGTWKIAYADFVTAMMAFFLLMWLIGANSEARLRGVAEYFRTPLAVAFASGKDMSDRSTILDAGSNSPIDGNAQLKKGETTGASLIDLSDGKREAQRIEMTHLRELKRRLEQEIEANAELRKFKDQFQIDITTDGLRIQIIDKQNRPMFDLGSASLEPYTVDILHKFGSVLNGVPNRIGITGHTDATPYQGATRNYSNWELSLDRANAARRALIGGGMQDEKIIRVVGLSSSALFDSADPFSSHNRRISIIVMNAQAENTVRMDGARLENE